MRISRRFLMFFFGDHRTRRPIYRGLACCLAGLIAAGCATRSATEGDPAAESYPRFYLEGRGPYGGERSRELVLPVSGTQVAVDPLPVLVETDIESIEVVQVDLGLCLRFGLTPAAGRALHRMSLQERGSRLVLMIDEEPAGVRVIDDLIQDGYLYTFLEVPDDSLPEMAEAMRKAVERAHR